MEDYVLPDGREVQIKEIPFDTEYEPWSHYKLEDGTTVRVRTVVMKTFRVYGKDGEPEFTAGGEPHIVVRHVTHITTLEAE